MEKTTGQIIYENRRKKRLTQAALAEKLNVTDKAVSKWERDVSKPDINLIPKISEVLEIPVEDLLNIPLNPQQAERKKAAKTGKFTAPRNTAYDDTDDWEYGVHRSIVIKLLTQGAIGFVAGFLFTLIMAVSDGEPFHFGQALLVGFFLSGVFYGWELLQKIIGSWFVVGSIPLMIIVFMLKVVGSVLIGWFAYPVALFYNLYQSQKKGSIARKVCMIIFAVILIFLAVFLMIASGVGRRDKPKDVVRDEIIQMAAAGNQDILLEDGASAGENHAIAMDASYFHPTKVAYCDVVENAFGKSLAEEEEDRSSGYEILEPSSLQSCYFMTMKEPGTTHYDFGDDVTFTNAVCVVTHYRVKLAAKMERDYWRVYMYPDFTLDENGLLIYPEEKHMRILFLLQIGMKYTNGYAKSTAI